ncbi:urease accessory protein UreE [Immundisolibacter sp.]|uniref:urease accessory protein UreE n=1 Tax=Immundisolibacter sp. TaxID=1934948 RepID=UPI0026247A8C|nr:urease accessory protein UreE [Immundisolibacter sp.]MDD3652258.1 urease accessory protein UreE [Immundisolibacter sp.]
METFDRLDAEAVGETDATVALAWERRTRSRQRVVLADGTALMLALPRGTVLRNGDVLRSNSGRRLRILAAPETVSTAHAEDGAMLLRAAYHLGNRHVAVEIGAGWLRYLHDHVLDDMLRGLGLTVAVEQASFEPEAGAYAPGHGHGHGHA